MYTSHGLGIGPKSWTKARQTHGAGAVLTRLDVSVSPL
ncbi:hypothetical protein PEV8663_03741 [Pelagimonas varians]|uniref:Uncharacterized protein n=1 Tax=Pelagimonas varians TaxID=696760 RepID=A0A238KZB9_9RHOB|nr:hypothetical protein PEV8663_03741 [Pelagimonas varians]